jgi:hypothetical protein
MSLRHWLAAVGLSAAAAGVALGAAAAPGHSRWHASCFADHPVTRVLPYRADLVAGQGTHTALVGARAFVPAEPGLTAEWLHSQLVRRANNPRPRSQCPLDLPSVELHVQSAGPGFWVNMSSRNPKIAREVLRRTERLVR